MSFIRPAVLLWICMCLFAAATTSAQVAPPPKPAADTSGSAIFAKKCLQCHQATMWNSLKQDRKAWESVLYRMVGRGALWTQDEINAMADFLAQTRGPAK
jgi:cytochrome c